MATFVRPELHHEGPESGRNHTPSGPDRVFTIRDLIRECGVTARTLRFYEEKGLLSPRRQGQDRLYSRRDRARLKYVLIGKRVGFSLDEVREMLDLYGIDGGQTTQLTAALAKFRERIARLEQQKTEIAHVIDELRRASETVEGMLAGETGPKPRVRMKAARQDLRGESTGRD
jgi:DNA-binding transcriptional MerR regulator